MCKIYEKGSGTSVSYTFRVINRRSDFSITIDDNSTTDKDCIDSQAKNASQKKGNIQTL